MAAFVRSASQPSTSYTVANPGTPSIRCTCPYSERGNLCKHAVKANSFPHKVVPKLMLNWILQEKVGLDHESVHLKLCMQVALMMEPRLREGHFIRYEGTLKSTSSGGLTAMYASLTAVPPSEAGCSPPSSHEPQRESRSAPLTASQAPAAAAMLGTVDLAKQLVIFEQLTRCISTAQGDEDPLCPLYAAAIRHCNLELQRIRARHDCPRGIQPAMPLHANDVASASMSRVRLKSCLEAGHNRSRAPAKPSSPSSPQRSHGQHHSTGLRWSSLCP